MTKQSFVLAMVFVAVIAAVEMLQAQETKEEWLRVSEEDELQPVRQIQERLDKRLGEPLEKLDLDIIMEGPAFFGHTPRSLRWSGDGSRLWFQWQRWDEEEGGTFEYDVRSGELTRLEDEVAERVPPAWGALWRTDRSQAIWSGSDGVASYSDASGFRWLIKGLKGLRVLDYADDDGYLLSFNNNVLLLLETANGPVIEQLSDIRTGKEPDTEPKTRSQQWQQEQQRALFEFIQRRWQEREEREAERKEKEAEPYYLGGYQLVNLGASRDGAYADLILHLKGSKARTAEMPQYVTESGYTESRGVRIKVGDELDRYSMTVLHLETGLAATVDFGLEDRGISIMGREWSPDNSRLLVQVRAQDNKDRWFFLITPELVKDGETTEFTASAEILAHDHDEAWINWDVARNNGWLPDGSAVYFISEREGWRNLYLQKPGSEEPEGLFTGARIIHSLDFHRQWNGFVVEASLEGNPHEVQTFFVPLEGSQTRQLTTDLGRAQGSVSPDGSHIATVASFSTKPPELFFKRADADGLGEQLTDSPSPAFKSYQWIDPPIVHITAQDGTKVPAQIYAPQAGTASGAGVVFVHGAGYRQNVHRWWRGSSYGRSYCFQHLLMEAGYTVIDIDFRGSEGYGRDWRTAIYRSMGDKDLSDQVDGARYLMEHYGVEPGRIGIYGGSYGGFITLMALFKEGDVFTAGVAMRPVTDWSAYNHPYTSNILNTPQEDPEAYLFSSPIYHAEGLKGHLLITHGIEDDNVHIQGVFRLVQRLIELRKKNWDVAVYPIEPHGFREPSSWVDQYYRIKQLFDETLHP